MKSKEMEQSVVEQPAASKEPGDFSPSCCAYRYHMVNPQVHQEESLLQKGEIEVKWRKVAAKEAPFIHKTPTAALPQPRSQLETGA